MTPAEIFEAIGRLTVDEFRELNRLLIEGFGEGGVGVREPRRPAPESPGDAIVADLPEDYWETAE